MPAWLLALCLPAAAQSTLPTDIRTEADLAAAAALKQAAIQTRSVRALLPRAEKMAVQWSQNAKLYGILGKTPRNEERYEAETWTFYFGDPQSKDGAFEVRFANEELAMRQGIKGEVLMREYYKGGALDGRHTQRVEFLPHDYENCRPVTPKFADSVALAEELHRAEIAPAELGQYRVALFHARNDQCDILGRMSTLLTEKPVPPKYRRRTVWVVTGGAESVYFDGRTAKRLLRRERGNGALDH